MWQNYFIMLRKLLFIILVSVTLIDLNAHNSFSDSIFTAMKKINNDESEFVKLFYMARDYEDSNTEFALECAFKASELADIMDDLVKRAEVNVLIGDILNSKKLYPKALTYYDNAVSCFIQLNDYKKVNKLYLHISNLLYISHFDQNWIFGALNNALTYANKTNSDIILIETYMAFGDLNLKLSNDSLALSYYDKILKYPLTKSNISFLTKALTNKASIKINNLNYDEAKSLLDSALYLSIRDFNDEYQIINYSYKGDLYDSLRIPDTAELFYNIAINISSDVRDYDKCAANMYKLGILKKRQHDYENAINVFTILCDSTRIYRKYDLCSDSYGQLSDCYAKLGKYQNAFDMHLLHDTYYDSATVLKAENKIQELRDNYILSLSINELNAKNMELNNLKQKRYNYMITILASLTIMVLLIIFVVLSSRNKMLLHKNKEAEYLQKIKIDEMEKSMIEMQLKNSKESLLNLAFHLKSYIDTITPIKVELKELLNQPEDKIKNKLKIIYLNIQNNRLFNEINELQNQIDDLYKDFIMKLEQKFPSITKAEKRLCVMLYIDMSSKEISVITNTSIRSVETSRYRLRKKFNLKTDKDIVDFLREI